MKMAFMSNNVSTRQKIKENTNNIDEEDDPMVTRKAINKRTSSIGFTRERRASLFVPRNQLDQM